jgi:Tol biopolymer transport system component
MSSGRPVDHVADSGEVHDPHRLIEDVCQRALDLDGDARAAFLDRACAGDASLRAAVDAMLAHEHTARHFIEAPAIALAARAGRDATELVGREIGPYRIVALLGAGGMGRVYRAHDLRVGRDVAIKVLPPDVAHHAERLARFDREARLLAALNHPNIAALYGLEHVGPVSALVMELIDGEILARRIARIRSTAHRHLPMADVLSIARQLADALHAAHEKGIVHRDLKPANVIIRPDGVVKVLDFGIAKALVRERGDVPTDESEASSLATREGLVLGTPAYMSPEQAQGHPIDKRTDVWAFGCLLYEMLTGAPPFTRATLPDTLASVIARDPDWTAVPPATPAPLRRLLRRCLQKDRAHRLADIADARLEIDDAIASTNEKEPSRDAAGSRLRRVLRWGTAAVLLVALGAVVHEFVTRAPPPVPIRFALPVQPAQDPRIALSPDGKRLAFVAANAKGIDAVWIRRFDQLDATVLAGSEGAIAPFWSPDGRSIAFFAGGNLKRSPIDGGPVRTIVSGLRPQSGAPAGNWGSTDVILYAQTLGPLHAVSANGGEAMPVTALDESRAEFGHYNPVFLPDGDRFLYDVGASQDHSGLYVGSLSSTLKHRLTNNRLSSALLANDMLLFVDAGLLQAQAFDPRTLELTGSPTPIAEGVQAMTASAAGALAYRVARPPQTQLTWLDRTGASSSRVGSPGRYESLALSPEEGRVAVSRDGDIWVLDLVRGTESRVASDPGWENLPVWSPDGLEILYVQGGRADKMGGELRRISASGTAASTTVLRRPLVWPSGWSRDGAVVTYYGSGPTNTVDLYVLPMTGEARPVAYLESRVQEMHNRLAPNGKWMAYTSNETGSQEVYVQTFPRSDQRWRISVEGGLHPVWRDDGRELYFVQPDLTMMVATVTAAPDVSFGVPRRLFRINAAIGGGRQPYSVSRDGQRFLVNTIAEAAEPSLVVVLDWSPETAQARSR